MPLPKTTDVGKIIRKLNEEGGRSKKQKVAIALDVARKAGAKIPKPQFRHRKFNLSSDGILRSSSPHRSRTLVPRRSFIFKGNADSVRKGFVGSPVIRRGPIPRTPIPHSSVIEGFTAKKKGKFLPQTTSKRL